MPDDLHNILSPIECQTVFENVILNGSGDKDGNDDQNVSASYMDR